MVGGLRQILGRFLRPDLAPAVGADRVFNGLAGRGSDEERTIAAPLIALWGILVPDRRLCQFRCPGKLRGHKQDGRSASSARHSMQN